MANTKINVQGSEITIIQVNNEDFISLTDMVKSFDDGSDVIGKWMRNINTIEFLGIWEGMYNPNFKLPEFGEFKKNAGYNAFTLSPKKWIESTNAIGITSKSGRYGGTYAHKDIAFEFGTWLSPAFKLYLIKEFQRLKEQENNAGNLEWNVRRVLSKANYHLTTLAVKEFRIPQENIPQDRQGYAYAEEADILNYAIFGYSAKAWKDANPDLAKQGLNARDVASVNELTVLSNIESLNSVMIRSNMPKYERGPELRRIAQQQLAQLSAINIDKSYKTMLGLPPEQKKIDNKVPSPTPSPLKRAQEIVNPELSAFNKSLKQALKFNPKDKPPEKDPNSLF